ncbi:type VII secretion protein EccB [Cellulomonas endometrii]|uniref:type VII secretion protein EccB n=1 Tax=Cellulomonas endometrii TaxID=3036301 RepID=UPI0024ACE2E9|nr:type VII secretion protein EccB [Cellulomonas endometrii]
MASKRDLVEAQSYSRRRLLTAFTSGAPGGRELEPTKPLRGVVAGVSLSVLLVLGSLGFGLLSPTLPDGWDDQSLVIVEGDGSRYVGIQGTLHPVLNVTSARLVLDSASFHVVDVSEDDITDAPRGATIGIPGAPDELPLASRLTATGWRACVAAGGGTALDLDPDSPAPAASAEAGALVEVADTLYLVAGGTRHRIPPADEAAVLRALGLDTAEPVAAGADWLNLVPTGSDLEPLTVADAGSSALPAGGLPVDTRVGTLVEVSGVGDGARRYVVDAAGELAPLSELAYPLYLLGAGDLAAEPLRVTSAEIAAVRTSATPVAPADLPEAVPTLAGAGQTVCLSLSTGDAAGVQLVVRDGAAPDPGVRVAPGSGALVRAQSAEGAAASVRLVDGSGRAYPVPDASDEVLARLGYAAGDVTRVPPAWAELLPTGPTLTVEAAATEVSGGTAADSGTGSATGSATDSAAGRTPEPAATGAP